jgi:hypothetical protein
MLPTFEDDHRAGLHNGAPAPSTCVLCRVAAPTVPPPAPPWEFEVFNADRAGSTHVLAFCADPFAALEAADALRKVFPREYVAAHHPDTVDWGVSGDFFDTDSPIVERWLEKQDTNTLYRMAAQRVGVNYYDGGTRELAIDALTAGCVREMTEAARYGYTLESVELERVETAQANEDAVCSCPSPTAPPKDCLGCLVHGEDAEHALQQESEIAAENAWLRHAEYDPRMDDPREW